MIARRQDIQALRGIAILFVVLYHAQDTWLPGGYLGVDIFFVISGFLITRMIADGIERGDFTLGRFWYARAKRLLPAAIVTIFVTTALAALILTGFDLERAGRQALYALFFASNVYFSQNIGYFAPAADYQPLLHFWSLSLEEQYYLFLPLLLFALPRRAWVPTIAVLSAVSLLLCLRPSFGMSMRDVFFLPQTRIWELGLGSLATLSTPGIVNRIRTMRWLAWPLLIIIAVLAYWPIEAAAPQLSYRPGPSAIMTCIATALLLLIHHPVIERARVTAILGLLGTISYALYLVHWPVLAFTRNLMFASELEPSVAIVAVVISLILAWGLHRWVEHPIHRSHHITRRQFLTWLAIGAAGTAALAIAIMFLSTTPSPSVMARKGGFQGLSPECSFDGRFTPPAPCMTAPHPRYLIWGDSAAMAITPGLAADPAFTLIQATKPLCGPILGRTPVASGFFDLAWSRDCMRFNESVMRWIESDANIKVVVLLSVLAPYAEIDQYPHNMVQGRVVPSDPRAAIDDLARTVARIRAAGKRVVMLAAPPSADFDVGMCLERTSAGKLSARIRAGCAIPISEYRTRRGGVMAMLDAIPAIADVPLIRIDLEMCRSGTCIVTLDGQPLYYDKGHLTANGARLVAQRLKLTARIERLAR